jgi:hypothetical protein
VALSVLTWAPRFGEAADATVTGTGRFVFRKFVGTQEVEVGIKRARVEMCDDDGIFGCQLMAVGETDDDGHFSVTGRAGDFLGDLPDPLVKVIAQSDAATIEDAGVLGGTFCFRSDPRLDRPNGSTVDFGTISPITGQGCVVGGDVDDQNDAWELHNLAVEARDFMRTFTLVTPGRDVPSVKVRWPADRTAYDRPDWLSANGTISFLRMGGRWERFFMKQYGHHVLQHFADNPVPDFNNGLCDTDVDPFGVQTGRCYWQAEKGAIHWTEGFPIFLSEVLTRFWGYQGFGGYRIGPGPHPHRDTNFHLVPEVTATILWNTLGWATALGETVGMDTDGDNHDTNNSKDNLSVGFETIWDAIINFDPASGDPAHNHPQTIGEFWLAFTFLHPDLANRLSAVYDESHITMLAANLEAIWVSGSPEVVYPGGTLTIDNITANSGYVRVGEPSITQFYLSTDLVLGSGDILIGQRTVPNMLPGSDRADRGSVTVVIPPSVPPGTYFIVACADGPGVIFESNESDNCTASGASVQIVEPPVTPGLPTDLGQFKADGTTALPVGAWTNQTTVVLRFTMADGSRTDSLVPEVEIKPVATAFNGTGLRAGSPVASTGAPIPGSVTVTGLSNGLAYHWRVRVRDAAGHVSGWASFGGNAETSGDVSVDTTAPSGSVNIDSGAAWADTPSVSLKLTCSDAKSGCTTMQLSNDNVTFTPPEAFAATRTWTLAGSDAVKTVYVRYLDRAGNVSQSFRDTITLDSAGPVVGSITATPNPFEPQRGQTTTIRIPVSDNLSGSCPLQIRILDAAGGLVKSMPRTVTCSAAGTTTSVVWDGRNAANVPVPAGIYTIEVAATDRAGNAGAVARGTVVAQ